MGLTRTKLLHALSEQGLQRRTIGPTESNHGAILEDYGELAVRLGLELFHPVEVHHRGAMDADEPARLAELKRAGVQVAIGSDLFGDAVTEALYLNRLGAFGTDETLTMLTRTTPQLMFPKRRIGKLEPGYEGSFLSLGCDPRRRLECIREIGLRVKQGMILRPAQN